MGSAASLEARTGTDDGRRQNAYLHDALGMAQVVSVRQPGRQQAPYQ